MKLITLLILNIFILNSASANLPMSWISEAPESLDKSNDLTEASRDLDNILEAKTDMLENLDAEKKTKKVGQRWFLQSIMTEIGVENAGGIGIVGVKGETAVEFVWNRTPNSVKALQQKYYGTSTAPEKEVVEEKSEESNLRISEDDSKEDLEKKIKPIVDIAFKSGKIKHKETFKRELLSKVNEFQTLINSMAHSPEMTSWWAYKFQLAVKFEASGKVVPFVKVGAGFRLVLEWYRSQKKNNVVRAREILRGNSIASKNAKYIYALAKDFNTLEPLTLRNRKYGLDVIKAGIGVGASGTIVLASVKGEVMGSIFFKREQIKDKSFEADVELGDELPILGDADEKSISYAKEKGLDYELVGLNQKALFNGEDGQAEYKGSRKMFRKGLKKAVKMANFFSRGALRREDRRLRQGKTLNFHLKAVEMELEVYLSGGVGLATIYGKAELALFLVKRD